jgi:ArsR family transcriptional regulator, arsenate/arsenite/antimonite-responsive transcriptional repressor
LILAKYFYNIGNMEITQAVAILSALSQDTRLAVFRHLVAAGPSGIPAGVIASTLRVAAPTLSFHLKELEHVGLITQRRESRNIIYAANYATMKALLSYLMQDCCGGRPEICDIDIACCAA